MLGIMSPATAKCILVIFLLSVALPVQGETCTFSETTPVIQPDGNERCVCDTTRHYCGPKEDSCVKYECTGNKTLHLNCTCTCTENYTENSQGDCVKVNIIRCGDAEVELPNGQCGRLRTGGTTKTTTHPTEYRRRLQRRSQRNRPEINVTNITSTSASLVVHVINPEDKKGFLDVHIYISQDNSLLREQRKNLDAVSNFTQLEVSNLAPDTTYTVSARVFLQKTRPSASSELWIRTVPENGYQQNRPKMEVTNITSTSATLVVHVIRSEFEDKKGFVDVHIYISQDNSLLREQRKNLDTDSNFTLLEVSNLAPDTTYTVSARVILQNTRPSAPSALQIRTVPENDEEGTTTKIEESSHTPSTELVRKEEKVQQQLTMLARKFKESCLSIRLTLRRIRRIISQMTKESSQIQRHLFKQYKKNLSFRKFKKSCLSIRLALKRFRRINQSGDEGKQSDTTPSIPTVPERP
ncbi:uncharacterized protein [Argopecten irradians]|uniref:uncharacterized protein isoform X2 n=1 Tax=Argopecten irradians TaxID=31199 RepID=UPI00371827E6